MRSRRRRSGSAACDGATPGLAFLPCVECRDEGDAGLFGVVAGRGRWLVGLSEQPTATASKAGSTRCDPHDRLPSPPRRQYASALITSPPATVPSPRQTNPSIVVLDEPHAAVAEQDVHAAGMVAARGDRRERRTADPLALAVDIDVGRRIARPAGCLLVGRPRGRHADVLHGHFGPFAMALEVIRTAGALVLGADRLAGRRTGSGCCSGLLICERMPQSRM